MDQIKIIECPRDAWQGLLRAIPTTAKVAYLAGLLEAGFRHIDAVSFVSPKAVPQMADSEAVMQALTAGHAALLDGAEIIGIVVNEPGFRRALATRGLTTIGFPYSISERFTRQNANMSQQESRRLVEKMLAELGRQGSASGTTVHSIVIYISMAFGNPYGEAWSAEMVVESVDWLRKSGLQAVSLADTVGKAGPADVAELFCMVKDCAPEIEIGLHLHSRPAGAAEKVLAAYEVGCRRFDCALTGLGGCPFAGDELVGNIPTEIVLKTLEGRGVFSGIEPSALARAVKHTQEFRAEFAV